MPKSTKKDEEKKLPALYKIANATETASHALANSPISSGENLMRKKKLFRRFINLVFSARYRQKKALNPQRFVPCRGIKWACQSRKKQRS